MPVPLRYPAHVNYMDEQEKKDEIVKIAEEHEVSIGTVVRKLVHDGLVAYYNRGSKL